MIAVIQCAASKRANAGHLKTAGGEPVIFVADGNCAPSDERHVVARPDEDSGTGASWREVLLAYNAEPNGNPHGLLQACDLYAHPVYRALVERLGTANVYILSAGWGLIRSDFLTPYYDITFSGSAEDYKRRRKNDEYADFRMLPATTSEPVVFFGGKDYLPLFCRLTEGIAGPRTIVYNSALPPADRLCQHRRFNTATRTNWHYECVGAFLGGHFDPISRESGSS